MRAISTTQTTLGKTKAVGANLAFPHSIRRGLLGSTVAIALLGQWTTEPVVAGPTTRLAEGPGGQHGITRPLLLDKQRPIAALLSFLSYAPNWDGYEGQTPSSRTIDNCVKFIQLIPNGIAMPRPGLSGDGEVAFFWEHPSLYIDIGFKGDDTYSFYARDAAGREYFGDEIPLGNNIDERILKLLPVV